MIFTHFSVSGKLISHLGKSRKNVNGLPLTRKAFQ